MSVLCTLCTVCRRAGTLKISPHGIGNKIIPTYSTSTCGFEKQITLMKPMVFPNDLRYSLHPRHYSIYQS
jgi:hypothetical protein